MNILVFDGSEASIKRFDDLKKSIAKKDAYSAKHYSKKLANDEETDFFLVIFEEDDVVAYPTGSYSFNDNIKDILGGDWEGCHYATPMTTVLAQSKKIRAEFYCLDNAIGPLNRMSPLLSFDQPIYGRILCVSFQYNIHDSSRDSVNFTRNQVEILQSRIKYPIRFSETAVTPYADFGGTDKYKKKHGAFSEVKLLTGEEAERYQAEKAINFVLFKKKLANERANKKCYVCKKPTKFSCTKCFNVNYCGKDCQRSNWTEHKTVCAKKLLV